MLKSEILAALEKIHGDPEIEIKNVSEPWVCSGCGSPIIVPHYQIDRINEYPRPEIVVIEK